MERISKLCLMLGLVISSGLFFAIAANADEADESTTVTFSAPVEIPGHVLPAGSYLFKLADHGSDPNIVEIYNADETKFYGTVMTISTARQNPTGDTTVTLVQQGSGAPDALLKRFYPGRLTGAEFLYPGHQEKQLAQDVQHTILAGAKTSNSTAQAGE